MISGFDISLLPPLQLTCPSVSKMKYSPSLSVVSVPFGAKFLLCNSFTESLRPLVPLQLLHQLFTLLHSASHPGVQVSLRLISARLVWSGSPVTWALGQDLVSGVKGVRFKLTFFLQFWPFLCLPGDFLMSTLTAWVLFLPAMVSLIF